MQGASKRGRKSSRSTSPANGGPARGALKVAAMPAATPQVSSSRSSWRGLPVSRENPLPAMAPNWAGRPGPPRRKGRPRRTACRRRIWPAAPATSWGRTGLAALPITRGMPPPPMAGCQASRQCTAKASRHRAQNQAASAIPCPLALASRESSTWSAPFQGQTIGYRDGSRCKAHHCPFQGVEQTAPSPRCCSDCPWFRPPCAERRRQVCRRRFSRPVSWQCPKS